MRTADLARRFSENSELSELLDLQQSVEWRSICYEARPVLLAASYLSKPTKTLIVTTSYDRALAWQAKLQICGIPKESISQLPSGSSALFEDAAPEHIALSDRLGALRMLAQDAPNIVIATVQSALERTIPKDVLLDAYITIKPGDEISPDKLLRQLVSLGYEPQEPVRLPGQFSRRGGIIDIFATGRDLPVRIELFGDEIESIRMFDPNTQRSVDTIPELSLSPSRETLFTGQEEGYQEMILDSAERESGLLDHDAAERLLETISEDAEGLVNRVFFNRLDLYRPLLHPDSGCAVDLLEENELLVLDEPLELETIANRTSEDLSQALQARHHRGEILASMANDFCVPIEQVSYHPRTLALCAFDALPDWLDITRQREISAVSLEAYRGRSETLTLTLKTYLKDGYEVTFTTDQPNRATNVLAGAEIFASAEEFGPGTPTVVQGNLGGGFVLSHFNTAVISDAELFGVARLRLPQKRFMEGAPVNTVLDLKPGDYVVHIHFGIGIFRGLTKKEVDGVEREFLFIEYQAPDKLFVPADQLDRIQKYLNPSDENPKLNKLTGNEWTRTLSKAKEEAKAFARDLVKLYAERKRVTRQEYGPDTPFQQEMEQTFPWVETPSQLTAIRDVKVDMRMEYPMDRLVCGDVGFGKTEIAIRAAFKAVQSGRQVAVLCPTTILSEQHYRNFLDRLGSFGTQIGLINRFTHTQEKHRIMKALKSGELEMIIGTHSLLGVGVEFKQLGMVIIDEEQRFGVKQKEMLKNLRTEVDVLTLSATPIPRTLSMALMDIRQMSLINDPPPGRLPIRTFVRPYANEVVREAIFRELSRGGQIFYVYNRVEGIHHVAEKLRKMIPSARIGVGHGQMNEKELEPIMVGFVKGEIDILLSTTIVESGIDIPNANTLIVENADRLGLAQLYQLRGRVGRSDRQAYGYFLYQGKMEEKPLTVEEAQRQASGLKVKKRFGSVTEGAMARLQALQEFSSLGSGYSLAFRDLQIRGAGELLGAKQSGTMVTVGYELYTQLINEAVAMLKNSVDGTPAELADEVRDPLESLEPLPQFEVPVVALLPESYIKDQAQRLFYYQQMMSARNQTRLGEVQSEIEDRYGRAMLEVTQAFAIMSLRLQARELGINKLDARQGRISIQFTDRSTIPPMAISILGKKNRECYATRESVIWPYAGAPIPAIDRFLTTFKAALAEVERIKRV